ncbi:MAG: TonB family protein [candidate division WOR-3 bacterium]
MKKFIVTLLFIILLSCQRMEEFHYSDKRGGMLIIALFEEPSSLNPIYPSISGLSPVTEQIFAPLISERPDGKVRPALAESWVYSEDLKSITYTIAKGATWHDGKPITAEDVVFTVNQILKKENKSPLAQKLNYVESVEALSPREVRFNLNRVFAGELQVTNIRPIPKHILEKEENLINADFNLNPIGSGPFKLKEWNKGKWIELVANEGYFKGIPPLNRIVFYTPSSIEELMSELGRGSVDLAYDLPPGDYDTLTSYVKVLSPGRSYTYIGWNLKRFPNKELRKALSMAIDRKRIISEVLKNYGQVVDGPITPEHWAYNPELRTLNEDKETARKIIEGLGYSKSKKEAYYKGLSVNILVEQENEIRKRVGEIVASNLRGIGVQANVVPVSGVELIKRLFEGDFDAYILGWNVEKEFNPFPIWSSDGVYNFVGYKNRKVDSLIGEALLSLDREKAKEALYEFQRIIRDDLPYTFLYTPRKITLLKKGIQGITEEDRRPILSYVDELWFERIPEVSVDLASLGESYKKEEEVSRPELVRPPRANPVAEEVLQASAPTQVPERRPTLTTPTKVEPEKPADTALEEEEEAPKFIPYEVPPKPLNLDKVSFPYPEAARRLGITGTVYLNLWITEEGNVTKVVLAKSAHPILDKVAIENAKNLKFSPAMQGNRPVAIWYSFPVRFVE